MICTKCNQEGVLNTILGQDFYYCRSCKEEIVLQLVDISENAESPYAGLSTQEIAELNNAIDSINWGV